MARLAVRTPAQVCAARAVVAITMLEAALKYAGDSIGVVFLEGGYGWLALAREALP